MINNNIPSRFGVSRTYTKFIVGFVVLTIILVFVIFYFSFSKALIRVTSEVSTVAADFIADIDTQGQDSLESTLQGTIFEVDVEKEQKFAATGSKDVEGDIIGSVTIYNNLDNSQPLVATTRLETPDGIWLRIKNRVDVPAKGSVTADVYAHDPSSFESLPPTKFTIPGLSESLQTKVYAESSSTISSKPGSIKVIKSVDIARAKEVLETELYDQAVAEFNNEIDSNYVAVVVAKKVLEEEINAQVDQVADEFTAKQKIRVTIIGIEQQDIVALAAERLTQLVSANMELTKIKMDNLSYVVQNYDEENKTANVKIHAEGEAILKENSEILDKSKLAGLSARGVELYLSSFDEVDSVNVELSPFWVKKIPKIQENITIEVVNIPTN